MIVPLDISAVKEYGIGKWQKDFFCPVSDQEFIALYNAIEQCFVDEINRQTRELKTILIIQYRALTIEYANFLYALKIIKKIRNREMDLFYSAEARWYKNLLSNGDIDVQIARIGGLVRRGKNRREAIKSFGKSILYNRNPFKYLTSARDNKVVKIAGGSFDPFNRFNPFNSLVKQYLKMMPQWIHFTSQENWLPSNYDYELPEELEDGLRYCSKKVIGKLDSIANEIGVELLDRHKKHLEQLAEEEFIGTAKMLHSLKEKIKNHKKIHLLLLARGNPLYKTLAIAVHECGGTVTHFAHGGDIGLINRELSLPSYFDIPLGDEFVTYTTESAKLYRRIKADHSKCENNPLCVISAESEEYFKLWKKYSNPPLPVKNRRVMIVGSPHHQWRKPMMAGFPLVHLDWELRLVYVLKKAGYDVLYKVHPNRISEVEEIFSKRVKVIKGHFEDVLDKADVFLFGLITTSALAPALCTNKPIVALDTDSKLLDAFPEAAELFKKRCTIVHTDRDEWNRITFSEKELLNAITREPHQPNTEFIEKYMFPDRVKK